MNQLRDSIRYLSIPDVWEKQILNCFLGNPARMKREAEIAYDGAMQQFPICRRSPLERVTILCLNTALYRESYRKRNIPDSIIRDTLWEVTRLLQIYYDRTGRIGLSKENVIWLRHIHNTQLFQIGSLQYQLFHMVYLDEEGIGERYMQFSSEQKRILPPGTPVINLHIPEGADLSDQAVSDSMDMAKQVIHASFSQFGANHFLCYSWLLYPPMGELLPEYSKIASFANRFDIIGQVQDPYGSDAVKRIYGKRYARKCDYPQFTELQRQALHNFSKLGMGCGIIEIK